MSAPHLKQDIMSIEKIQRQFIKSLWGFKNAVYTDRLAKLGLPSLRLRHLQLYLVYCYKIVFVMVKLNSSDFFEFSTMLSWGGMRINCLNWEGVMSEQTFSHRVVNVWNSLPFSVSFTNLSAFKRWIRSVDFTEFLKCGNN